VLAGWGNGENAAHQGGHFFSHKGEVAPAVDHIGVVTAVHIGHDDGQAARFGIAFHRGPAQPGGVVVGVAVQQVEDRVFTPRVWLLGQQDVQRSAHGERFGGEVDFGENH
jgi:hypothetical protein